MIIQSLGAPASSSLVFCHHKGLPKKGREMTDRRGTHTYPCPFPHPSCRRLVDTIFFFVCFVLVWVLYFFFCRRTLWPQRIFLFVVPNLLPSLSWNYYRCLWFYLRIKAPIFICSFCPLNVEKESVHLHSFLRGSIIIQQISGFHWNLELNCLEPEGIQAAVFPWAVFLYKHLIVSKSDVQYVKTWIWCK